MPKRVFLACLLMSLTRFALAEDTGSEKAAGLFSKFEEKLLKAGSVRVRVRQETQLGRHTKPGKGRVLLARGNKARIELQSDVRKRRPTTLGMVSDGKTMRVFTRPGSFSAVDGLNYKTPKDLSRRLRTTLARAGARKALMIFVEQDNEVGQASSFRLGAKKRSNGLLTQQIHFEISVKGSSSPTSCSLWIDTATSLPVRRIQITRQGQIEFTVEEHYEEFELDGTLDEAEFDVAD